MPGAAVLLAAVVLTNVFVQVALRARMDVLLPALHAIPALAGIASRWGALDEPILTPETAPLAKAASELRTLRVATAWMFVRAIPGE